MSVIADNLLNHRLHITPLSSNIFPPSMMATEFDSDRRLSSANGGSFMPTALFIRKLPRNTTTEALKTMLLFAQDFQDAELVPNEYPEDTGFVTAVVRFSSVAGALEAQSLLDGKPNTAGQANMIVEIVSHGGLGNGRRNTLETASARSSLQPISPPPASMPKSSRFNGAFQAIDKMSPPPVSSPPEQLVAGGKTLQTIFLPHSPNQLKEGARISGKTIIGEDAADDETGKLLNDPLAYMKNDSPGLFPSSRPQSNHRMPVAAFSALSLNTNMTTSSPPSFASPRSALHPNTPNNAFSPGGNPYQGSANHYLRHNYPPVNPADQNPPCNTLYVGNLPMDTSEDELKAMFSKQRGYKRLCFRTKQNGPMCFVEFEDISFATKALNELYGAQLHNSVKGGIRLSFSKNPLGVRSGQPGSNNPTSPLSPGVGMLNGMQPMSPGGFGTANGPPPGLSAPPGLHASNSLSPTLSNGQFQNPSFPLGMSPLPVGRGVSMSNGSNGSQNGNGYPDYMMGR